MNGGGIWLSNPFPTSQPSAQSTRQPSALPSGQPSAEPSSPSSQPSSQPSARSTSQPSFRPSELNRVVPRPSSLKQDRVHSHQVSPVLSLSVARPHNPAFSRVFTLVLSQAVDQRVNQVPDLPSSLRVSPLLNRVGCRVLNQLRILVRSRVASRLRSQVQVRRLSPASSLALSLVRSLAVCQPCSRL